MYVEWIMFIHVFYSRNSICKDKFKSIIFPVYVSQASDGCWITFCLHAQIPFSLWWNHLWSDMCISNCISSMCRIAKLHLKRRHTRGKQSKSGRQQSEKKRRRIHLASAETQAAISRRLCKALQLSSCGKRVAAFLYYNIWRVLLYATATSLPWGQWHTRSNLDCRMPTRWVSIM